MSFGRNPHVAKAEAEEQKAGVARDAAAAELAWREAARQWDRAADRENDGKKKAEYTARAETARANADGDSSATDATANESATKSKPPHTLN